MSYVLPDKDMPIAEATYMSLYGATGSADYSIEAAADEVDKLGIYNLNNHDCEGFETTEHSTKEHRLIPSTAHKDSDAASGITAITYQSIDEALFELKFRTRKKRKSTSQSGRARRGSTVGTVGTSPIGMALFNMLAGAGVVGLPVTYKNSGLATGIAMMAMVAVLSVYTLRLQVATGKKVQCEDYERLVSKAFGATGYYLISFSILIFDIGACITYTIILGNSARDVMDYLFGGFWGSFESRQLVIFTIYCGLILPFCLGKNFEFIEKVSALAIMVVVLMIIVVLNEYYSEYREFSEDTHHGMDRNVIWWISRDYMNILAALGTISFAFIQHDLAFLVYKTLRNNTLKRYTILATLGMAIQCLLCTVMAIYGYLSFGADTNDDILTNYPIGNHLVLGIRILYTFRMAFVFPTAFYVVRHIGYAIVFRGMETFEHATRRRQIVFTLIPWSTFLAVGLFVDDLGFVMSLAGLLSALNIAFVLPSLCHLKLGTEYSVMFWKAKKGEKCKACLETFPCLILIVFGIIAGVTGSIGLVIEQWL